MGTRRNTNIAGIAGCTLQSQAAFGTGRSSLGLSGSIGALGGRAFTNLVHTTPRAFFHGQGMQGEEEFTHDSSISY
jgi:hypothetical protein